MKLETVAKRGLIYGAILIVMQKSGISKMIGQLLDPIEGMFDMSDSSS